MVRSKYYHDPAQKHIEQYQDFSGGLNTVSSNDNMATNELARLENINLGDRGSLTRRKGFRSVSNVDATGKPQGLFRFHRNHAPYNLLGMEGAFDGLKKQVGQNTTIGAWYAFSMSNEADVYKVEREQSAELVHNGDFELGEEGWNLDIDGRYGGESFVGRSVYAQSGNNVLRITSFKNHVGFVNEYQITTEAIPVVPGEVVHARVNYHRSSYTVGLPVYRAHIIANVRKSDGTNEHIYVRAYDVGDDWKTLEGEFVMPADAESVYFGLGILDNDVENDRSVYFENLEAWKDDDNIVLNGDFEQGTLGWVLDAADSFIGESVYAYRGANVLRVTSPEGSEGFVNEYQDFSESIPVVPGDEIYAEVMYRESSDTVGGVPYRAHLIASIEMEDGTRDRQYIRKYDVNNTWQKVSGYFTMPTGAVSVVFGVGILDNDPSQDISAYFDVLRVQKKNAYLVRNGDFENGEDGWHLDTSNIPVGDSYIGGSVSAYNGANVLRVRSFKDNIGFVNEYQSFNGEIATSEGEEVYAEAMYTRADDSIGNIPHRVHLVASIKLEDGTRERQYVRKYDCDSTWKKISGYFTMPEGAVSVIFGVGILDDDPSQDIAAYFDAIYARKEIASLENGAVAIRATLEDTATNRGIGARFDGMKSNAYYLFAVSYKSDGTGVGSLAVRDERYGVYPNDNGLVYKEVFEDSPTEWTTKYIKFKTYDGMSAFRAYVYNHSPLGTANTVFFDDARLYELTTEEYEKIDVDAEYTGEKLGEKFPFRIGKLYTKHIVETITAVGGTFYIDGVEKKVEGDIPIQPDRPMEAVSYGGALYIASGTALLVYNGSTIAKVSPYLPDSLETLYIGSNGLRTNPFEVSDKEQSVVEVRQIQFSKRYGKTNENITLTVGVNKPGGTALEYKYERRNVRDKEGYWFTLQDFSQDNSVNFKTDIAGEYQFKISVRIAGETDILDSYTIPKYIIKPASVDKNDLPIDANTIHLCNRIILHWDRLILYGDPSKQDVIYISDLQNPSYFPVNNSLRFENPRKERITNITRFRDNLVVFTPSSIQALFGTSPETYERYMLNTDVGCIADRSARVVGNYVVFLSYEGITLLKTVGQSETKANIELIDSKVSNIVNYDTNVFAYVRDNQYCIVFPDDKRQLRYYYEWRVWAQDVSDSLDMVDGVVEDSKLIALGTDGRLLYDADNYADEGVPFQAVIGTKLFFFGEPYAIKKTKELQIMVDPVEKDTNIKANVYLDTTFPGKYTRVIQDFDYNIEQNKDEQYWVTEITPNHAGTIKKGFSFGEIGGERETISSFAERNDAFLTFNASGYGSNGSLPGLQVVDGEVIQLPDGTEAFPESAVIYKDGTMGILNGLTDDLTDVMQSFHFGPYMIKDGVKRSSYPVNDYIIDQKHPRQGIGQRADGSYVMITVDGRSAIAEGVTIAEFADIFEKEGCVQAYNLDGGGSAQTYVDGEPLNVYADGEERPVGDFLYVPNTTVEITDEEQEGLIKSEVVALNTEEDVYKMIIAGKGLSVSTALIHEEDKPVKLVGLGYIFKLKNP